ncbi:MAG: hypothetical protein JST68_17230 [Bacteroidetes bacterium]|nr:hypothetical protein [Bacteroidota bacterium]
MKQLLLFSLLLLTASGASFAQAGRIRITFAGFDCIKETVDDMLERDGKGDEVYFNFGFTLANRNGQTKLTYEKKTPEYGDATPPWTNRVRAGSRTDAFGGNKGGLRSGDTYRCNDIVGEYDMADGDILTIVPTAWEVDPVADNWNVFAANMANLYQTLNQKIAPIMITFHALTGDIGGLIFQSTSLGVSKIQRAGGDQGASGKPGTRPIGMDMNGDFGPKLLVLNTPNMSTVTNSNFGYGKGVVAVNYNEESIGNYRDHGNYSILLKVEFTPTSGGAVPPPAPHASTPPPPSGSTGNTGYVPPPTGASGYVPPPVNSSNNTRTTVPPPPAPAPAPAASTGKTPAPMTALNPAIKTNAIVTRTSPLTATLPPDLLSYTWVGTRDGQPFAFRFANNAIWILKDLTNNSTEGAGSYNISGNVMIANYSVAGVDQYTLTTTGYNINTGELSGTWQKTNNAAQKGTWVVKKRL